MQKTYVSVSEANVASINESSISETCWGGGGGGGGAGGGGPSALGRAQGRLKHSVLSGLRRCLSGSNLW